jgi:trans-aconitate methyltransferase
MENKDAYNHWSVDYDTVINKTRDAEAIAFRHLLSKVNFATVIELGCGTGKNTLWLAERAARVLAVDFSEEMTRQRESYRGRILTL